ncbi:hypothetical protein B0H66DRAFT_515380 [Apodospora peruviana]|uniref:Zn(2)-C6 fungal-type domain-containing protein n=1 Tax=Apodospora peruviana TaxID=516989 RepID=A0AAE0ICS7_9PEZI|nr:hypothetical protein B0H66DRAFT_515380 [Apodospora peruviana]
MTAQSSKITPAKRQAAVRKGTTGPRKNSKTGCRTCKIRRVRCDELRPACYRCVSTGRVCDGYGIWGGGGNAYGTAERLANIQAAQYARPQEEAALDFFRHKTSTKMPGVFRSNFWDTLVFQASFREPAVLHAVIALAATHKRSTYLGNGQYNKAIRHLRHHLEKKEDAYSLRVALISCMVFLCLDLLKGQFVTGRAHLQGGLQLLQELQERNGVHASFDNKSSSPNGSDREQAVISVRRPESVDDHLVEAFTRLNVQSALFGQGSEYLYQIGQNDNCGQQYKIPAVFDSLNTARRHLDILLNGVHLLSVQVSTTSVSSDLVRRKEHLQSSLVEWFTAFQSSLPKLSAGRTGAEQQRAYLGLPLLRLYHIMATIICATCLRESDETVFDSYTADFATILEQASDLWRRVARVMRLPTTAGGSGGCFLTPHPYGGGVDISFTVDMGFIPPLYYLALKCRVPKFRRYAIRFLEAAPHREGVWDGNVAAAVARRIMDVEEDGFYSGLCSSLDGHVDDYLGLCTGDRRLKGDDVPLVPGGRRIGKDVAVRLPERLGDGRVEIAYYMPGARSWYNGGGGDHEEGDGRWVTETVCVG